MGSIRIGTVSSINSAAGTVRVTFPDRDDAVSTELPVIRIGGFYALPSVGDPAVCLFPNDGPEGYFLGSFFVSSVPGVSAGESVVVGDLTVKGDVTITGTLHGGGL
jgi:phage baseplate assembly protein gpV